MYVYEQSGVSKETRGKNPHAHIRFKSSAKPGVIEQAVLRAVKLEKSGIRLLVHPNVNALRQYMLGNKSDPAKKAATVQDKIWRIENGLRMEYMVQAGKLAVASET